MDEERESGKIKWLAKVIWLMGSRPGIKNRIQMQLNYFLFLVLEVGNMFALSTGYINSQSHVTKNV